MIFLRRIFAALFNFTIGPVLALILIFEEWGWEPLARLMARLAKLPLWARMEAFIVRLPPYAALVVFFVPALMLLPVKLLALYWISRGHTFFGIAVVLVAKMLGTAAVARLFSLTQPALMQLAWFARLYGRWKLWKDALIARMKSSPVWLATAARVHSLKIWIRSLLD
jgi:hypothetical protein